MDIVTGQRLLIDLGYDLGASGADGDWGKRSKAAAVQFQKSAGIVETGMLDAVTASALQAAKIARGVKTAIASSGFVYPEPALLKKLFPRARMDIIVPFCEALPLVLPKLQMASVLRLGHFIGQCGVETAGFDTYQEYASGDAYDTRTDLGNTPERDGDGRRYKGRGPLQLTGLDNYRRATPWVARLLGRPGLDLTKTPEIVETDRAVGLATSLWFWDQNKLNNWADKDDAAAVSRGVNRGNPLSRKPANHEAERIAATKRVVAALASIQPRI